MEDPNIELPGFNLYLKGFGCNLYDIAAVGVTLPYIYESNLF